MSSFEGGKPFEDKGKGEPITDFDRKVYAALDKGGQWFGKDFKQYLVEYFSLNQPLVPFGQIIGASQFTVQAADVVNTQETTTSTSYTNLSTVGPSLSGLSDGDYLIIISCICQSSDAAEAAIMSTEINGSTANADVDRAQVGGVGFTNTVAFAVRTLASGSGNAIVAKYRSTDAGATATFLLRKMYALKMTN